MTTASIQVCERREKAKGPLERMSNVFFFRLHKLRRQQEQEQERRQQLQQQQRLSSSGSLNASDRRMRRMSRLRHLTRPSLHCPSLVDRANVLTMVPGRLFERPATMDPSDSLDYVALQIPRYHFSQCRLRLPLFLSSLARHDEN